jgi:hypothetical protein
MDALIFVLTWAAGCIFGIGCGMVIEVKRLKRYLHEATRS